jgi:hypothetical protein
MEMDNSIIEEDVKVEETTPTATAAATTPVDDPVHTVTTEYEPSFKFSSIPLINSIHIKGVASNYLRTDNSYFQRGPRDEVSNIMRMRVDVIFIYLSASYRLNRRLNVLLYCNRALVTYE